jgi:hypothetical protein
LHEYTLRIEHKAFGGKAKGASAGGAAKGTVCAHGKWRSRWRYSPFGRARICGIPDSCNMRVKSIPRYCPVHAVIPAKAGIQGFYSILLRGA